jgi:hypothetical protein
MGIREIEHYFIADGFDQKTAVFPRNLPGFEENTLDEPKGGSIAQGFIQFGAVTQIRKQHGARMAAGYFLSSDGCHPIVR